MSIISHSPIRVSTAVALLLVGCASAPPVIGPAALAPDLAVFERRPRARAGDITLRQVQGEALTRDPMRPLLDVLTGYWPFVGRADPRSMQAFTDDAVGVYASNNSYLGGIDLLRAMRSSEVLRVQRLTRAEAYQRFGRTHANGAVVITRVFNGR